MIPLIVGLVTLVCVIGWKHSNIFAALLISALYVYGGGGFLYFLWSMALESGAGAVVQSALAVLSVLVCCFVWGVIREMLQLIRG